MKATNNHHAATLPGPRAATSRGERKVLVGLQFTKEPSISVIRPRGDSGRFVQRPEIHEGPLLVDTGPIDADDDTGLGTEALVPWDSLYLNHELVWAHVNAFGRDLDLYSGYSETGRFLTAEQGLASGEEVITQKKRSGVQRTILRRRSEADASDEITAVERCRDDFPESGRLFISIVRRSCRKVYEIFKSSDSSKI